MVEFREDWDSEATTTWLEIFNDKFSGFDRILESVDGFELARMTFKRYSRSSETAKNTRVINAQGVTVRLIDSILYRVRDK